MLQRYDDWFDFFGISASDAQRGAEVAQRATELSAGMLAGPDFRALAAALLHQRPTRIFEIGTHMGATAEFFLDLLPQAHVVSLDYFPDDDMDAGFSARPAGISFDQIGAKISAANRSRFTQIIGDARLIVPRDFVARRGVQDFVFIAGEPTAEALHINTLLAKKVIGDQGAIAWHGANPKRKYIALRTYLERDLDLNAMATADNFIGGVALWSPALQARLLAKAA